MPLRSAPGYVLAAPAGRTNKCDVLLFLKIFATFFKNSPCLCAPKKISASLRLKTISVSLRLRVQKKLCALASLRFKNSLCVSVFRKSFAGFASSVFFLTLRLGVFAFKFAFEKASKVAVSPPESAAFGLQKCHFRTPKRPFLPRSQVPVSGSFRDKMGGKRSHKP